MTLVELAVTMGLLALLVMAVLPEMGSWSRNMQIRDTAESIQTGLQRARQEAVTQNRIVRFSLVTTDDPAVLDDSCTLSESGRSWVVSMDDPEDQCGVEPSPTTAPRIIARAPGGSGSNRAATVSALNAEGEAASWLAFDNYGRVQSGAPSIVRIDVNSTLTDEEKRPLRLIVTPAGSIRMCDPSITEATDSRKCP